MLTRRQVLASASAVGAFALTGSARSASTPAADPPPQHRLGLVDHGQVLVHGNGPGGSDLHGAREGIVYTDPSRPGTLLMHYDGAGSNGWLACGAESVNGGKNWHKLGAVLHLDSCPQDKASASSPWVIQDIDGTWHMYYLGARIATSSPNFIPEAPYVTLHATATSSSGPWTQTGIVILDVKPGTWHAQSASPGPVMRWNGQWVMWFSGSSSAGETVGLATAATLAGPWTIAAKPLLPPTQRLENAAIFQDPRTQLWWMFADHIGTVKGTDGRLYTDAIWGYYSTSPLSFSVSRSVIVMDAKTCTWSKVIGMPSVIVNPHTLSLFYDGDAGRVRTDHMNRDIALATLSFPLTPS